MTYEDALAFINSIARFGSKPGLKRVSMLLERMGNPQNRLRFIHVAGTNGKGSTCAMLSHILVQAGYKTGLYISPFVIDFCERIQIDNQMIPKDALAASTEVVKAHWDALDSIGETPTEFEVVVAVAMDYFLRENCDVVVLEVGMGGRYDATNVIDTPLASVITNIGIDHTEYLGETIDEIAHEKCGIIKPGGITVTYPHQSPAALAVITERCAESQNRLFIGAEAEILCSDITGSHIRCHNLEIHVPLIGRHQVYNAVTVVEAIYSVRERGLPVSDDDILNGIAQTRFPARLEILSTKPLTLLDGAHNVSGAQALTEAPALLEGHRIHAIIGMMSDKDVTGFFKILLPRCASVTAVTLPGSRAMPSNEIARQAMAYCDEIYMAETCASAFVQTLYHCSGNDVLLMCGSLYLAGQMRPIALEFLSKLK